MREDLKQVMKEVRRNEAVIEYMELKGMMPETMRSIGDVTQAIVARLNVEDMRHAD
jgi:hypothetical protein